MEQYIPKSALVAEIERMIKHYNESAKEFGDEGYNDNVLMEQCKANACKHILSFLDTLEVKEVDVWKTVDNVNPPQADKNKIYCVLSKNKYLLARVINNPQDEDLLQWKCTEFPFHRYDMCEGDKYMQIV